MSVVVKAVKGIFGGGKKKAAAPEDQKGPVVKPLTATEAVNADPRRRKNSGSPATGGYGSFGTILSDKLGG